MLDRDALKLYVVVAIITGVLFSKEAPMASTIFIAIALFLLVLSWCIKPYKLELKVKDLFDDNQTTNALKKRYREDAEFNSALTYVHGLSKSDFLAFCRISVEVRLQTDQEGLSMVAKWFKGAR